LIRQAGDTNINAQVEQAFELAFGRSPKQQEAVAARDLIKQHGLVIFCRAMLNANEFLYIM
jgi:hypothetical protein